MITYGRKFISTCSCKSMGKTYLPTFYMVVGGHDPPLRIVVASGIGSDNNFCIILYFLKDFEEYVTCIKVLNYCNSLEKSMFKD